MPILPGPVQTLISNSMDRARSWVDASPARARDLEQARNSDSFQGVYDKSEPLVSVCVGTYNRAELLTTRCLPSILGQTYRNLDVIVVGDACTDDTFERLKAFRDKRLRYVNLEQRGVYPENPRFRWMVAGTKSVNHALGMAQGDFITHLDDDDEYLPDRIEKLLRFSLSRHLELAWHPFYMQNTDESWHIRPCEELAYGSITTSSCLYHHWFKRIEWNINAWKLREPGDWNRFRKFKHLKVRAGRFPEPLLRHFRERAQRPDNTVT